MLHLSSIQDKQLVFDKDENGRTIYVYRLRDSVVSSINLKYPNIFFYSYNLQDFYNPLEEKIMSLLDVKQTSVDCVSYNYTKVDSTPYFFFGYNTDNYYHYVYDTLPYLISFLKLKKEIPDLKLLLGDPVHGAAHYRFVTELLSIAGIREEDIIIIRASTLYKEIYISSSYTHGIDSNLPPRKEIYSFYHELTSVCNDDEVYPDKIYISRRTWLHNDLSNIGTNYTTRRKLVNENDLVTFLNRKNYKEIFTEQLTTVQKLNLFKSVKSVVGAIGGGMCNVLFSPKETNVNVLVSPTFLDINSRFKYCFDNTKVNYFTDAEHVEEGQFKKFMRVQHTLSGIVGEVENIYKDALDIKYSDISLAGWNSNLEYKTLKMSRDECKALDGGLNSSWKINISSLNTVK
jgi:hypothetical protein